MQYHGEIGIKGVGKTSPHNNRPTKGFAMAYEGLNYVCNYYVSSDACEMGVVSIISLACSQMSIHENWASGWVGHGDRHVQEMEGHRAQISNPPIATL